MFDGINRLVFSFKGALYSDIPFKKGLSSLNSKAIPISILAYIPKFTCFPLGKKHLVRNKHPLSPIILEP